MKKILLFLAAAAMLFSASCSKSDDFNDEYGVGSETIDISKIPANEIWYTSVDDSVVKPSERYYLPYIISNTYEKSNGIIKFDSNVTKIGFCAFRDCSSLETITIPNGVITIDKQAFMGCYSLTSIAISSSVISISDGVFRNCSSLTSIAIPNGVTSIGKYSFCGCSSLTGITIPDSVTLIGEGTFYGCTSLTSVTIPNSVTSIGSAAFKNCSSLESITISNSVTSIGTDAFKNCLKLSGFYGKYASEDNRCLIVDGVLRSFAPYEVTTYIIPSNVTSIGTEAFKGCLLLASITIPNSVTSIGYAAFENCFSLESITIPNSVTSIDTEAFKNCFKLTNLYCNAKNAPKLGNSVFYDSCPSKIYVPMGSVEAYKKADGWKEYANIIEGYNFDE